MLNERVLKELELYEKEYGKSIDKEVVERVINKFSEAGHSGFSANYAIGYIYSMIDDFIGTNERLSQSISECTDPQGLAMQKMMVSNITETYNQMITLSSEEKKAVTKLLEHKPLTPLYGTDDEWEDVSKYWGSELPNYKVAEYQNKRNSTVFKTVYTNGLEIATAINDEVYSDNGGISFYSTGSYGRKQITFPYEEKEPEKIYLYKSKEGCVPYILTDPDTIKKVRDLYEKELNN